MKNSSIKPNVILNPKVRQLLNDFAALMKLPVVFFGTDYSEIERGQNSACSAYCSHMQKERFGLDACIALDKAKHAECMEKKQIMFYTCHAGLGEIIAPVKVFDNVVGVIVFGQLRISKKIPPFLQTREEKRLYLKRPLFSGDEIKSLQNMLQMLLDYITEKELVNYPQDQRMMSIRQYILNHIGQKISLAEVARASNCSKSTLTHLLLKKGTSFSKLVMEARLERAEELLVQQPELAQKDIARSCGFNTPFYMARVFRKLRNTTPGQFRKEKVH